MGSFNTSCMVSHQIIVPGAEVFILPIEQKATDSPVEISKDEQKLSPYGVTSSTCYPTAFWGYAGPIIRGVYDDYGCFTISDTSENKSNMISFFKSLVKFSYATKQGENEYHEHAFNIHELFNPETSYSFEQLLVIWEKMWDVSSEHRLFVDHYGAPRNLQFAVIHRAAADYLIKQVNKLNHYDDTSYEQKIYFRHYISSEFNYSMEGLKKNFRKDDIISCFEFFCSKVQSLYGYGLGDQEGCSISRYYREFDSVMDLLMADYSKNPENFKISNELINQLFIIFKSNIDHRYIHAGLNMFDIKLCPMVYASQDYDNTTGQAYAKMIKAVSSTITKDIDNTF